MNTKEIIGFIAIIILSSMLMAMMLNFSQQDQKVWKNQIREVKDIKIYEHEIVVLYIEENIIKIARLRIENVEFEINNESEIPTMVITDFNWDYSNNIRIVKRVKIYISEKALETFK